MKKCALTIILFLLLVIPVVVGQATILDLTTAGSSGMLNDAWFYQADPQATGSGVIDSFVRISTNDPVEEGYNTSGRPVPFDENTSPTFTHDLLLSAVPVVDIGGTAYREFLLDINQTGPGSLISLDKLTLYMGATGGINSDTFAGLTSIWDLDVPEDNWIKLDYNLNPGSGAGDMFAYIPSSLFTGGDYVYLYSKLGENFANNDGYEEWAVREPGPPTQVPEPATLLLFGLGLVGLAGIRRKLN